MYSSLLFCFVSDRTVSHKFTLQLLLISFQFFNEFQTSITISVISKFSLMFKYANQSIQKEISPGCSWEGLMLKLKLQYFGHLLQRTDSLKRLRCWERSQAGGEGDNRGWDGWMASLTQWKWVWVNSGRWWWSGRPGVLRFVGSQRVGHDWATEPSWTEL